MTDLRACPSCAVDLEDWRWPLEIGAYVPCFPCGRIYLVTAPGLDAVDRLQLPEELLLVVDEFARLWWDIQVVPVPVAG